MYIRRKNARNKWAARNWNSTRRKADKKRAQQHREQGESTSACSDLRPVSVEPERRQ
jgi:hypothetical protein